MEPEANAAWRRRVTAARLEPCRPPVWARGGHAQTLIAHFAPSPSATAAGERLLIPLEDGDKLSAWHQRGRENVLLYLFHGLGGSERSDYIQRMLRLAERRGWHALAVNHRGSGPGRGLAAKLYHSGSAGDLAAAIRFGRERHPQKKHLALGFSLSGNALLLLAAGKRGGDAPPDFAVAVNAPIALEKAALSMKKGLNRIYDLTFNIKCRRLVMERFRDGLIDHDYGIPLFGSLHDFDNIYTASAGGFRDREDYYESCSAKPHLSQIAIPTALLTAKDDPMVDFRDYLDADLSPQTMLHLEAHGGHMGYLCSEPTPLGDRRWLDYALDRILRAFLGQ